MNDLRVPPWLGKPSSQSIASYLTSRLTDVDPVILTQWTHYPNGFTNIGQSIPSPIVIKHLIFPLSSGKRLDNYGKSPSFIGKSMTNEACNQSQTLKFPWIAIGWFNMPLSCSTICQITHPLVGIIDVNIHDIYTLLFKQCHYCLCRFTLHVVNNPVPVVPHKAVAEVSE